jgi:hypothetical protein
MKSIEIVITSKGETTVTTKGFAGQTCREASGPIELALGLRTSETLTAEFHQTVPTAPVIRQQG